MSTLTPTRTDITVTVETVTPEQAEEWLVDAAENRLPSERRIPIYAEQMLSGDWVFDGSPIRFNEKGELIDGQHRLMAQVRADVSMEWVIIRGIDHAAMATMDTGKSRTFVDILKIENPDIADAANVAAVTRLTSAWEQGRRGGALLANAGTIKQRAHSSHMANLSFYRDNQERLETLTKRARVFAKSTPGFSSTTLAGAIWVLDELDAEGTEWFFSHLASGIDLTAEHPVLTLRNRGLSEARLDSRAKISVDVALAFIFIAWNAWKRGRTLKRMSYSPGGVLPDPFPMPINKEV